MDLSWSLSKPVREAIGAGQFSLSLKALIAQTVCDSHYTNRQYQPNLHVLQPSRRYGHTVKKETTWYTSWFSGSVSIAEDAQEAETTMELDIHRQNSIFM